LEPSALLRWFGSPKHDWTSVSGLDVLPRQFLEEPVSQLCPGQAWRRTCSKKVSLEADSLTGRCETVHQFAV
jgi:hypothetical protein